MNTIEPAVGTYNYFQLLNDRIYGDANKKVYPQPLEIIAKIAIYAGRLKENGIQQGNKGVIIHCSVMAFSWQMAFANRLGFIDDIHARMYQHFLKCPYCVGNPCECWKRKGPKPLRRQFNYNPHSNPSVDAFQKHSAELYPRNTLVRSGDHFMAEVTEVMGAQMTHSHYPSPESLAHVVEEFCDMNAHLAAIANTADFSLAAETAEVFKNGCPGECRSWKCRCGYTDVVVG